MAIKLLLIGDARKNRRMFAWGFAADTYQLKLASSRAAVLALIEGERFHAACIDWKMRDDDAVGIAATLHTRLPELPVVALIGENDQSVASSLKEFGVAAHLVTPFPIETLHAILRTYALPEAVTCGREPKPATRIQQTRMDAAQQLRPTDETSRRTLELALRAAKSNAAILVLGETGTGKSLLARTIHEHSAIRHKPFVTVNCPCLNHELLESELFGHVRGAFTGAVQDTRGKVAAADGGTLFLDEIGDLPMALQPKLLRLLQEKQYERVGEAVSCSADVRIIAATNRDLRSEVAAGRFREDLYYRVNVISVDVPALRGRPSQIMSAAESFLETICAQLGKPSPGFSREARTILESYAWPGNLRELRNVVERAAILSTSAVLGAEDFPALLASPSGSALQIGGPISLAALENAHIQMVVANSASLEEAARILEIDKSTLYRKRKQMESRVTQFTVPSDSRAVAVATAS
jgi:NtrC-family two-component system response regulator AlgB